MTLLNVHTLNILLAAFGEGLSIPAAAARADEQGVSIHPQTIRNWLHRGEHAVEVLRAAGAPDPEVAPLDDFPETERIYVEFARQVRGARDQATAELMATAHHAATQPRVRRIVKRTLNREGEEVGQVITEETLPPDADLALRLAGIHEPAFREKRAVEVSGPGGGPIPIEGFTEAQALALATYTRALLDNLLDLLPPRTRQRVERHQVDIIQDAYQRLADTPALPPGGPPP